jgi:hypothetical protein
MPHLTKMSNFRLMADHGQKEKLFISIHIQKNQYHYYNK